MNEKLSALMDGELARDEARAVIKTLGVDQAQREHWDVYHLVGACLRGDLVGNSSAEGFARGACTAAIFERLAAEPTILAPAAIRRPAAAERKTRLVLAMAASVVTVSAVGVIMLKQQGTTDAPASVAQQAQPVNLLPEIALQRAKTEGRVNDYLVVHRQFTNANASALQAASLNRDDSTKKSAGR